jgi:hypothetical protein
MNQARQQKAAATARKQTPPAHRERNHDLQTVSAEASSSESWKEEFLRVRTPSMDGFRSYQSWSAAVVAAAHLKGIAIGKIRRNLAVIADRDIGALFAKLNVIAVVFE